MPSKLHQMIVDELVRVAQSRGLPWQREKKVDMGASCGFFDLWIDWPMRIGIECELRNCDRIAADLRKARAAELDVLLIVTATARTRDLIQRAIRNHLYGSDPEIFVLPLYQAIRWFEQLGSQEIHSVPERNRERER